jgi:hypothetical protein
MNFCKASGKNIPVPPAIILFRCTAKNATHVMKYMGGIIKEGGKFLVAGSGSVLQLQT